MEYRVYLMFNVKAKDRQEAENIGIDALNLLESDDNMDIFPHEALDANIFKVERVEKV